MSYMRIVILGAGFGGLACATALRKGLGQDHRIIVEYPKPETPWNLVFATKMSLAAFLISAHGFYTMSKPDEDLQ